MIPPDRPLHGRRVLITRAQQDSAVLRSSLEEEGATVLELPTVAIGPPQDPGPLDEALRRLTAYDWIVFTSRNAVQAVFDRLSALGLPSSLPSGLQVAAVGPATASALRTRGAAADCLPAESTGEALAATLAAREVRGARVLLPAGDLARPALRKALEMAGARVDQVVAYRTVRPAQVERPSLEALVRGEVDVLALASPSAIRNLVDLLNEDQASGSTTADRSPAIPLCLRYVRIVCIGPTTAQGVRELGLETAAVARQQTTDGLITAIVELYRTEKVIGQS